MVEINYRCANCDFSFKDRNLIFYIDTESNIEIDNLEDILNNKSNHLRLIEASLNKEISDKMTKSFISGFLYENYCPHCMELIKTYVPEDNELFTSMEIEEILIKEISKNKDRNNFKILFFDFKNTFYKDRRNILENNSCPNCHSPMSLLISEKIPCPKCGDKLIEEF